MRLSKLAWVTAAALAPAAAQQLANSQLAVTVNAPDGSYQLRAANRTVLTARVGAEIDRQWVRPSDYPQRRAAQSG